MINNSPDDEATVDEEGRTIDRKEKGGSRHLLVRHGWIGLGAVLLAFALFLVLKVMLPLFSDNSDDPLTTTSSGGSSESTDRAPQNAKKFKFATVSGEGSYSFGLQSGSGKNDTSTFNLEESAATALPEPESQCMTDADGTISSGEEESPLFPEINSVHPSWSEGAIGVGTWDTFIRTFDVDPSHTILEDGKGVTFNVETLPEALPEYSNQTHLPEEDILKKAKVEAGKYYRVEGYPEQPVPKVDLEVMSVITEGNLVFAGGQGFVAACMMAFAYHLPLAFSPDDLWTVILQGFAHHVDQHAEELRSNFVNHTGTKEIKIQEDSLRKGISSPKEWEDLVFPKFSQAIEQSMKNKLIHGLLVNTSFSTTTSASHAASEIVLMAAMKSYFDYTLVCIVSLVLAHDLVLTI